MPELGNADLDQQELVGIITLMRTHIEIRNRSFMRLVHRDCFLGSDAVDFLVTHGFADTRDKAADIGRRMMSKKLIRHVSDGSKFKDASHMYYRFLDDDDDSALLAATNGGNGNGLYLGQGGCKWSICPHTAHNSYIVDIGLSEEIERAVAGANVDARARAFAKLRARVKEQAEPDAPDWSLSQSTTVNGTVISVFQRKRPRGDFKNVKMTGMVGESARSFIRGIMSFERRKQWEAQFEDGVVVEGVDLGEGYSSILEPDDDASATNNAATPSANSATANTSATANANANTSNKASITPELSEEMEPSNPLLHPHAQSKGNNDVHSFLQTVDLAGVPSGMAIAFLNDAERQHALAHLRKQMMLSHPQDCMLCQTPFRSSADIRFCPCCAMVSCVSCVSKRVFEVVSRQVVSVCVHCCRESSRIRHPPQAVRDQTGIDASLRGRWWRPEELGMVDYSQSYKAPGLLGVSAAGSVKGLAFGSSSISSTYVSATTGSSSYANMSALDAASSISTTNSAHIATSGQTTSESASTSTANTSLADTSLLPPRRNSKPLLPGLLDDSHLASLEKLGLTYPEGGEGGEGDADAGAGLGIDGDVNLEHFLLDGVEEEEDNNTNTNANANANANANSSSASGPNLVDGASSSNNLAGVEQTLSPVPNLTLTRGDGIGREVDESDQHYPPVPDASAAAAIAGIALRNGQGNVTAPAFMSDKVARCKCCGVVISRDMLAIEAHMEVCGSPIGINNNTATATAGTNPGSRPSSPRGGLGLALSGVSGGVRDINRFGTRIIYRTARPSSRLFRPREVCSLQDSFVDPDGTCYLYEVSVRHCDVRGTPGYVTADVLTMMHVARPVRGSKNAAEITIVSQVDTRGKGTGQWLMSLLTSDEGVEIGVPRTEDLVRELQAQGDLRDILRREQEGEAAQCSLEDFELLAVLGRGGFGKVMQVRHKGTLKIYAMKVLKKSELRRRRQVERTQTERTILAAVKHPFIVCLHYAFQNTQKLYMVMDFVQGGDFFTLMRKHKRLPEDWVRIYIGEIALALQHLHDMDIVYRDLKPENILLCGDGHLKLTDFGLSRFFETRPPAAEDMIGEDDVVTRSFCGTEQYMSPEMLLQQGHNFRMDWWCLGLLMHEMISARHPFHGPSHYDTLRNMVTKQPTLDPRLSTQAATVVRSLLIKSPRARLCCRSGVTELKTLPFFHSLDWAALMEGGVEAPYKPNLTGTMDISSFEATFTREQAVDSIGDPSDKRGADRKGGIFSRLFGAGEAKGRSDDHDESFRGFGFVKEDGSEETDDARASTSTFTPAAPVRSPRTQGDSATPAPATAPSM